MTLLFRFLCLTSMPTGNASGVLVVLVLRAHTMILPAYARAGVLGFCTLHLCPVVQAVYVFVGGWHGPASNPTPSTGAPKGWIWMLKDGQLPMTCNFTCASHAHKDPPTGELCACL
jgi:hypothetical protein